MLKSITRKSAAYLGIAILTAGVLAGCSSKPNESDIRRQVDDIFQCSPFQVTAIKKTDGASLPDNQYQVAFDVEVEIKGGKSGAAALIANILQGTVDLEVARAARNQKPFNLRTEGDEKLVKQMENQLQELTGGDCESIQTFYLLESLLEGTKLKLKNQTGPIPIPYIAKIKGVANMRKAESGWLFTELSQFSTYDVIESEPQPFDRPGAKSANPALEETPSNTSVSPPPPVVEGVSALPDAPSASSNVTSLPVQSLQPQMVDDQNHGPSFYCAKAATWVEKNICAEPKLAALDMAVTNAYKASLLRATDKATAKSQQAEWRRNDRDRCSSTQCLSDALERRLAQLN